MAWAQPPAACLRPSDCHFLPCTAGGPAGTAFSPAAAEPRYARCPLPVDQWRAALRGWQAALAAAQPQLCRRTQVAVAVPSYRVSPAALATIFQRSTAQAIPAADVRLLVVVDNPGCPEGALEWLRSEQRRRLDGLRVRLSAKNQARAAFVVALATEDQTAAEAVCDSSPINWQIPCPVP